MQHARREARFIFVALMAALGLAGLIVLPYVNTLTLAIVIGIVFRPVAKRLRRYVKSEGIAAAIALLLALVLVVTPLAFFGFRAGQEALGLYEHITRDHTIGELRSTSVPLQKLTQHLPVSVQDAIPDHVNLGPILRSAGAWVVDRAGSLFGIVTSLSLDLFLLIIGTYYVIKDGRRFVDYLIKIAPIKSEYDETLFRKLHASVVSVVRGSIAIAVLQGAFAGLGFFLFGVPNAALWGAATMIAALIPIVGTSITLIPAIIYLAVMGSVGYAILLLIWGMLIVGFIDNVFRGQFMKRGLAVHPFLILLSVLGGLEFFGPIGFISGPLLLSILMALLDIYTSSRDKADALDAPATLAS